MSKDAPSRHRNLAFVSFVLGVASPLFFLLLIPLGTRFRPPRGWWERTVLPDLVMLAPLVVPILLGVIALATRRGRKYNAIVGISVPGVILVLLLWLRISYW